VLFGYFTLSDNRYEDNTRNANRFVADIIDEAVYAEEVGLHSAWIGEHHFSTLGVLSLPRSRARQRRRPDEAYPLGRAASPRHRRRAGRHRRRRSGWASPNGSPR
jgi:alkanesulfonate monooxygenase SsuD/methylene tetrahydromethanopterin reductase-like flavin-dependent oxidoreductase (luciferase family)